MFPLRQRSKRNDHNPTKYACSSRYSFKVTDAMLQSAKGWCLTNNIGWQEKCVDTAKHARLICIIPGTWQGIMNSTDWVIEKQTRTSEKWQRKGNMRKPNLEEKSVMWNYAFLFHCFIHCKGEIQTSLRLLQHTQCAQL